jgi:hypothetical protein
MMKQLEALAKEIPNLRGALNFVARGGAAAGFVLDLESGREENLSVPENVSRAFFGLGLSTGGSIGGDLVFTAVCGLIGLPTGGMGFAVCRGGSCRRGAGGSLAAGPVWGEIKKIAASAADALYGPGNRVAPAYDRYGGRSAYGA